MEEDLLSAISTGHVESVRKLLERVNLDDNHLPILIAARTKNVQITNLLLQKYSSKQSLISFLCEHGSDIIKFLLCFPDAIDRNSNPTIIKIWKQMLDDEKACIHRGRQVFRKYGKDNSRLVFLYVPEILSKSTIADTDENKLKRFMVEVQKFPK
jgi:hypothetical protein